LGACGYFGLIYFEYLTQWRADRRFQHLPTAQQEALKTQRAGLLPLLQ